MSFTSAIYRCEIFHHRLKPKNHFFRYKIFMFYLDLDEMESLNNRLFFFSRNRFNIFNFRDRDHLQLNQTGVSNDTKAQLTAYLTQNGVLRESIGKIYLLTNVSTLGYIFNPVSFYFIFNNSNNPINCVVEVCNTFNELKPYFIPTSDLQVDTFVNRQTKYFYVSPFINHDIEFNFQMKIPTETLNIKIDDLQNQETLLKTNLSGIKKRLNDANLLLYFLLFPFITIKIIVTIHWQALLLYLKKLPYLKKNEFTDLQRNVFRPYNSQN